jgi:MFS family permease
MLLARSRPSLFLPCLMFACEIMRPLPRLDSADTFFPSPGGAMSVGAKGIHNTAGLVAFRFCLGLVEAGFFPGVMLLLSCWYKVSSG